MIPNEVKVLLIVLVTEGIVSLGKRLGVDVSGNAAVLAAAIVSGLVTTADGLLVALPPEWQGVAGAMIQVLVLGLGAMGLNDFAKQAIKKAG